MSAPLPVLRNLRRRIVAPGPVDLVFLPQITGAYALRTTRLPAVVLVHDIGIVDSPADQVQHDLCSRWMLIKDFQQLPRATHVVADSQFTANRILHWYPQLNSKISVIPPGISNIFFSTHSQSQATKVMRSINPNLMGQPLLIYVGSEQPRKNIGTLLGAFKLVKKSCPHAQLLKVGSPGRDSWRAHSKRLMMRLGLQEGLDVHFIDYLDDELLV
ncbi:MAG: glycosyltransferase [Acidithiobacillus sp.]|nr:glycosyltransferase [Acidithiobacillus sp.]